MSFKNDVLKFEATLKLVGLLYPLGEQIVSTVINNVSNPTVDSVLVKVESYLKAAYATAETVIVDFESVWPPLEAMYRQLISGILAATGSQPAATPTSNTAH